MQELILYNRVWLLSALAGSVDLSWVVYNLFRATYSKLIPVNTKIMLPSSAFTMLRINYPLLRGPLLVVASLALPGYETAHSRAGRFLYHRLFFPSSLFLPNRVL